MSNVKSNNERSVVRLLLDVKNNRYVVSTIMRIDDLFITSLYLFEHRIQSSREIIYAFVDLQNAERKKKKRSERSEDQLNVTFFKFVIELC